MSETTINQRLNFLLGELGMKAGAFARALNLSETTIRNYVDRTAKPSSEVLEKIVTTFKQVNLVWLVTGVGEHFLSESQSSNTQTGNFNQAGTSNKQTIKGNKGPVQANNGDHSTINNVELEDCKRDLQTAQREIEHLTERLQDKEELLKAREDTIKLLRASFDRPN